jgi:hypothetical protein
MYTKTGPEGYQRLSSGTYIPFWAFLLFSGSARVYYIVQAQRNVRNNSSESVVINDFYAKTRLKKALKRY